jgi:hypothetical protein
VYRQSERANAEYEQGRIHRFMRKKAEQILDISVDRIMEDLADK